MTVFRLSSFYMKITQCKKLYTNWKKCIRCKIYDVKKNGIVNPNQKKYNNLALLVYSMTLNCYIGLKWTKVQISSTFVDICDFYLSLLSHNGNPARHEKNDRHTLARGVVYRHVGIFSRVECFETYNYWDKWSFHLLQNETYYQMQRVRCVMQRVRCEICWRRLEGIRKISFSINYN